MTISETNARLFERVSRYLYFWTYLSSNLKSLQTDLMHPGRGHPEMEPRLLLAVYDG